MTVTEGMLAIDYTHRDVILNIMENGMRLPMSIMPGEPVDHVFAGPKHDATIHFLESITLDRPVIVTPEQAQQVMEVYIAADISSERDEPVILPLSRINLSSLKFAS